MFQFRKIFQKKSPKNLLGTKTSLLITFFLFGSTSVPYCCFGSVFPILLKQKYRNLDIFGSVYVPLCWHVQYSINSLYNLNADAQLKISVKLRNSIPHPKNSRFLAGNSTISSRIYWKHSRKLIYAWTTVPAHQSSLRTFGFQNYRKMKHA